MFRILILASLALGTASAAQACDFHFGMFGYGPSAYAEDRAPTAEELRATEQAAQAARERAMDEARVAFLGRFKIRADADTPKAIPASTATEPSTDADRRSQPDASNR